MKKLFSIGALVCVLLFAGGMLGGCVALEKAREVYQARAEEADRAYKAWDDAIKELEKAEAIFVEFKTEWTALDRRVEEAEAALKAAEASGDPDAVAKAKEDAARARNELITLQDRGKLVLDKVTDAAQSAKVAEEAYNASEQLFKAAKEDLDKAESADDYLGTIFGWLGLGITSLLTGGAATGVVTAKVKNRRIARTEGERDQLGSVVAKTFSNAKKTLSNDDLERFKEAQANAMSEAEKMAAKLARVR